MKMTREILACCALSLVACGGLLAPEAADGADGGGAIAAPCLTTTCSPSLPGPTPDASFALPPPDDAGAPEDGTAARDARTPDAGSPADGNGEDTGILAACAGQANVLHFEVIGAGSPLPTESETYESVSGNGGPSSAGTIFASVTNATNNNDSIYVRMPTGYQLGTYAGDHLGSIVLQFLIDGILCSPASGTIDIADMDVTDASDHLGLLVMSFDLASSNCVSGSTHTVSQQELRGCVHYSE